MCKVILNDDTNLGGVVIAELRVVVAGICDGGIVARGGVLTVGLDGPQTLG